MFQGKKYIVNRKTGHVVGWIAEAAPAGIEDGKLIAIVKKNIKRMEVSMGAAQPARAAAQPKAPIEAEFLDGLQPRQRRGGHIAGIAVD